MNNAAPSAARTRSVATVESPLLTTEQAAEYLNIPISQVRRRVRYEIVPVKIGKHIRYEKRDLDAYISMHKEIWR